jgi:hypothetical protein
MIQLLQGKDLQKGSRYGLPTKDSGKALQQRPNLLTARQDGMTQKAAGGSNALQDKSFFLTDSYTQPAATNRNKHIRRCVVCYIAGHPPSLSILLDTPARPTVPGILSVHACAGAHACRPQSCSLPARVLCAGDTLQESTTTKMRPKTHSTDKKNQQVSPKRTGAPYVVSGKGPAQHARQHQDRYHAHTTRSFLA